jgi:hypothetical protein
MIKRANVHDNKNTFFKIIISYYVIYNMIKD